MVDAPGIRYAQCGEARIAFQTFGEGRVELILVPGGISHLGLAWQDRRYRQMIQRLAEFARVTVFDKRGMGASGPIRLAPTLEERMQDIGAVMDAIGAERAALFGLSEGATSAALFAATFPERTSALLLFGAFPSGVNVRDADPDFPGSVMREFWERTVPPWKERFGEGVTLELFAPSAADDERAVAAMAAMERAATTRAMFGSILDGVGDLDLRPILPNISAPTLVIHRREEPVPIEGARYMARRIPRAEIVEIEGDEHPPWLGDADIVTNEMRTFLTAASTSRA